jgi:type IV secretory pathway TraG/TraD family ATPase VirD4
LFGRAGAQEIQESCGTQIILGGGIRDIDSARRYAEMIGRTTVYYDDKLAQF